MKLSPLPFLLCLLAPLAALPAAERATTWPRWQQNRVALDRRLVREEFRIHYTLTGPDALPAADQADRNGDGVPDKIQDFAQQLVTARRCFVEVLGLRHPFESPRYAGRVKAIDVHVWALDGKNGSAGDAIVNFHRPSDPPEGVEVVTIDLAAKLPARNLSPAHELFHIFQNGYSQFKNAWYYEGTARMSEDLLRAGAGAVGALPGSAGEVETLFTQSYDASRFWQALGQLADAAGTVRVPSDLRAMRYLGSGNPVIEDDLFRGGTLLKALLKALDRADDGMSKADGLDPLNWPEKRQRAPENNRALWNAVIEVTAHLAPGAAPLPRLPDGSGRASE